MSTCRYGRDAATCPNCGSEITMYGLHVCFPHRNKTDAAEQSTTAALRQMQALWRDMDRRIAAIEEQQETAMRDIARSKVKGG